MFLSGIVDEVGAQLAKRRQRIIRHGEGTGGESDGLPRVLHWLPVAEWKMERDGACLWNCAKPDPHNPELTIVSFQAGADGLHSGEN